MEDVGRGEDHNMAAWVTIFCYLRDQGYDYEHQARQRSRCRADDDVKVLPRVKRQQHSHWHDGSGNGRQQSFGLIRRVMSILAFEANSILCCERVHQTTSMG